jgi:hypothetical protein
MRQEKGDRVIVCLKPHQTFKASQVLEGQAHGLLVVEGMRKRRGERARITESRAKERFYRSEVEYPGIAASSVDT